MKKVFVTLMVISTIACNKSDGDCYWQDNVSGNDWSRHPTAQEIQELEDSCSCTVTITKICD